VASLDPTEETSRSGYLDLIRRVLGAGSRHRLAYARRVSTQMCVLREILETLPSTPPFEHVLRAVNEPNQNIGISNNQNKAAKFHALPPLGVLA
jgi:hypothetical protein